MSAIRQHLTRKPHSLYLKLCPSCNTDILDEAEFTSQHGGNCQTPQKQRRRFGQEEQWHALYSIIRNRLVSQHNPQCKQLNQPQWTGLTSK